MVEKAVRVYRQTEPGRVRAERTSNVVPGSAAIISVAVRDASFHVPSASIRIWVSASAMNDISFDGPGQWGRLVEVSADGPCGDRYREPSLTG